MLERAVEFGKDDAAVLCSAGHALALVLGDLDSGAQPNYKVGLLIDDFDRFVRFRYAGHIAHISIRRLG